MHILGNGIVKIMNSTNNCWLHFGHIWSLFVNYANT